MAQRIIKSVDELLDEAEAEISTLSVKQALPLFDQADVVFVDLRDSRELDREGRIPGAFHCPRGSLEFAIDPTSPTHKPIFAEEKRFVFFCAGGLRSALAAFTAHRMGLGPVSHIAGGFGAWRNAGAPVALPEHAPGEALADLTGPRAVAA